jgi:hypothetical protein
MVIPVLVMIGLVMLGVQALRRQTAEEFPEVTADGTRASLHAAVGRAQRVVFGGRRGGNDAPASAEDVRVGQLERLARLHDTGALSDDEYAAEKSVVLANGVGTT